MGIRFDQVMSMHAWITSKFGHYAALPLRLFVGYGFMAHGYAKIVHGPERFINILHVIGAPAPEIAGWATILVELAGGFAVLVGAFVPLASVPLAAVMFVAMLTVQLPYGFSSIKLQAVTAAGAQFGPPGYEINLLYLACLTTLVLGGSGPFAVDSVLAASKARRNQETSAALVGQAGWASRN
jgi:putative oxidoreductase